MKQLEVDAASYGITWYTHPTTASPFQHRTHHFALFYNQAALWELSWLLKKKKSQLLGREEEP